jgi:REP element-mobilizing transposase RayT
MLPSRKKLPHQVPSWVPNGSRYFITINCAARGPNALAHQRVAASLLESITVYEQLQKWYIHAMVIMPDHIHMIVTFSTQDIRLVIAPWKGFQAKTHDIDWQSDFFEHRLRNDAEFTEKVNYVLMNPVRKGLVNDWQNWPYTFVRGKW